MERAAKPSPLKAFYAMTYRQIMRFLVAKSRIINSIVFPLMWFVFFGVGWSSAFKPLGPMAKMIFEGLNYMEFLAPGIIVMTTFTGGFTSGLSMLWDREFGYLKEILVAPASRTAVILGRIFGDSLTVLIQGAIMTLLLAALLGYMNPAGILLVLLVAWASAVESACLGIAITLSMRSPEGFHMVVNLLMLPMLFLSGAFFPLKPLPDWMKALAYINPLTYSVELARTVMYNVYSIPPAYSVVGLLVSTAVLLGVVVSRYSRTYIA